LVAEFELLIREAGRLAALGDWSGNTRVRNQANIIWRELKLRLCPTNQYGGPADVA
jgi:hypothetical protein